MIATTATPAVTAVAAAVVVKKGNWFVTACHPCMSPCLTPDSTITMEKSI